MTTEVKIISRTILAHGQEKPFLMDETAYVYTSFDNGTWDSFIKTQKKMKNNTITTEELLALADFCWDNCQDWRGPKMNDYSFQVGEKTIGFSWRGWGGWMSRVKHLKTGIKAEEMDYMDWYM